MGSPRCLTLITWMQPMPPALLTWVLELASWRCKVCISAAWVICLPALRPLRASHATHTHDTRSFSVL